MKTIQIQREEFVELAVAPDKQRANDKSVCDNCKINRTRVEILANILKVAGKRTLKTHIMYKANLSHRQLGKYLSLVQQKGLLEPFMEDGVRMFRVTEKGREFLQDYQRLNNHFTIPTEHVAR